MDSGEVTGAERLIPITHDPPNAGTPVHLLDGRSLAAGSVYRRNNFTPPQHPPGQFVVDFGTGIETSLTATTIDLLPHSTVDMVLECAGNARIHMNPIPAGTPWDLGGASPVTFSGPRLLDILDAVPDTIAELVFTGCDQGEVEPEGLVPYQFSLSRDLWARSILATRLSGAPLPRVHGGPVRLVVPGEYAMKSVKWVARIDGVTDPFRGHFVEKYRFFDDADETHGSPVGAIRVRSVIAHPVWGSTIGSNELTIRGSAWSGMGKIEAVELSIDGAHWVEAELSHGSGEYAATRWSLHVELADGSHQVSARALDSSGNLQPARPRWNRNGYGNNVIQRVDFEIITESAPR